MSTSPGVRPRPARASRALLVAALTILAATVAALLVAAIGHLRSPHTPVLPVSWVRAAGDKMLPPLSGARWFTS